MTSVPTSEAFIESFPNPVIPKIEVIPTYESIANVRSLLSANAASVASQRGGGNNGYLGIVLSDAVYTTVSGIPWVSPQYPGAMPNIPANATAAQTGEVVRQHTEALRDWKEYTNMQSALKKQLIAAVDPIYLRAIRNRHVGFKNHSVRDILQHLLTSYGNITAIDLDKNMEAMKAPWDPSQPFEVLIDQIEEAVTYADAGNQPFTDQQILNTA